MRAMKSCLFSCSKSEIYGTLDGTVLGFSPCTLKTEKLFNSEGEVSGDVVGCTSDFEVAMFGMGTASVEELGADRDGVPIVALEEALTELLPETAQLSSC